MEFIIQYGISLLNFLPGDSGKRGTSEARTRSGAKDKSRLKRRAVTFPGDDMGEMDGEDDWRGFGREDFGEGNIGGGDFGGGKSGGKGFGAMNGGK